MVERYSGRAIRATLLAAAAVGGYQLLGSLVVLVTRLGDPRSGPELSVWDLAMVPLGVAVALGVGMTWLLLSPVVAGSTLRRLLLVSGVATLLAAVLRALTTAGLNVAWGLAVPGGFGLENVVVIDATLGIPADLASGAVRLFPAVTLAALGLRQWFRRAERGALDPA